MADLAKYLDDLWNVPQPERDKGIELLSKIYANILNNPSEQKYRDLNFSKIQNKFNKCPSCIYLLFAAGFNKSDDGIRLQCINNQQNNKLLQDANDRLQAKINGDYDDGVLNATETNLATNVRIDDNEGEDIIEQLMILQLADNREEIENAMKNVVNPRDINEIADYIMNEENKQQFVELQNEIAVNDEKTTENNSVKDRGNESKDNNEDTINAEQGNAIKNGTKNQEEKKYESNEATSFNTNKLTENNKHYLNHILVPCNIYESNYCILDKSIIECKCVERIVQILKEYNLYINNKQQLPMNINKDIYGQIGNDYNNIYLMNDFNHLIYFHYTQFEDIYNLLLQTVYNNQACNLPKCLSMRRNQRDRMKSSILKDLYFTLENNEIISHQLIDRIHCYYIHSFDTGYKWTKQERDQLIDADIDENKLIINISRLIQYKKNKIKTAEGLERMITKNSKYITNQPHISTFMETKKLNQYKFGFRFFYNSIYTKKKYCDRVWDPVASFSFMGYWWVNHSSNDGFCIKNLYITPKYDNFKIELQQNDICSLHVTGWNNLDTMAMTHIQTDHARTFSCARRESARFYSMKYGYPLQTTHIIAMMVYCGYDKLQREFTETFRRLNEDESIEEIKTRHSNYYWLGKYLKQIVECFGMKHNNKENIQLYHGVNKQFTFKSLCANFKGPFSATTDYSVACNFATNSGMILELNIDVKTWIFKMFEGFEASSRITCFDAQWLSPYPNESEIFCIGGLNKFYFNSIIDVTTNINYIKYIKALKQMTSGMTSEAVSMEYFGADMDVPNTKEEQQMVYRLLAHQFYKYLPNDDHKEAIEFKSCPEYIKEIMDSTCNNIGLIHFMQQKHKVLDKMLRNDNNDWVNLDVVTKIFRNVSKIRYHAFDKELAFFEKPLIYQSILSYIDKNKNNDFTLENVSLWTDPKYQEKINRYLIKKQYHKKFKQCGWEINVYCFDAIDTFSDKIGRDITNDESFKHVMDFQMKQYKGLLSGMIKDFHTVKDCNYNKLECLVIEMMNAR